MLKNHMNSRWTIAAAVLLMSVTMTVAHAEDDDEDEGGSRSKKGSSNPVTNAKWKDECGSCHLAYPPRFLSAESWRAVMSGLDKHFGSNASLDAAAATEIGDFLAKNASTKQRNSSNGIEPPLRISDTRWFESEHRKVADRTWKDPKVKSPSNCAACHTQAQSGSYNEHDIRMPK
ncbi:MAG: diheme cytochrome c [Gallionella sp.]